MAHKFVVGTIAILLGGYVTYKAGSDFQFVRFEPHSPEEVARRKREKSYKNGSIGECYFGLDS